MVMAMVVIEMAMPQHDERTVCDTASCDADEASAIFAMETEEKEEEEEERSATLTMDPW